MSSEVSLWSLTTFLFSRVFPFVLIKKSSQSENHNAAHYLDGRAALYAQGASGTISGIIRGVICKLLFTGECCVALCSLAGASEQFETFLCHRGEEMGSIRGRVRIHVPKDRRGMREKTYGESTGTEPLLLFCPALTITSHWTFIPTVAAFRLLQLSHFFLYSVPQWCLAWLFALAGICRPLPLLAPDWLTPSRCILRH